MYLGKEENCCLYSGGEELWIPRIGGFSLLGEGGINAIEILGILSILGR